MIRNLAKIKDLAKAYGDWISEYKNNCDDQDLSIISKEFDIKYKKSIEESINYDLLSAQDMIKNKIVITYYTEHYEIYITSPWHINLINIIQLKKIKYIIYYTDIKNIEFKLNEIKKIDESMKFNEGNKEHKNEKISLSSIVASTNEVVKIVNSTLYNSYQSKASDIHFENLPDGLIIKYRVDGIIKTINKILNIDLANQIISRLKIMSNLDIGEKRIPQDGRFSVEIENIDLDFRVSIIPGIFREDAVLRILDKNKYINLDNNITIKKLGFNMIEKSLLNSIAKQPHGLVLATGPTGSGKTTTLYALITEVSTEAEKLVTIEDPVEYILPNSLQIPVSEKKGLTFAKGLRSILRHDPDKIFVGEIRDKETGEIAIQAALTGHLVFTSVHANSVFDVIDRFEHMQINKNSLINSLNGIIGQRLIRILCDNCKTFDNSNQSYTSNGCLNCNNTGFIGRKVLTEILVFNDDVRNIFLTNSSTHQIRLECIDFGFKTIRERGLMLVKNGETSMVELNRVCFK